MTSIEQVKLKRAGVGLRAWDPDKACPGLTLFTPMGAESTVYLIDLGGEIAHTWYMPYPALYAYLTERGAAGQPVVDRRQHRFEVAEQGQQEQVELAYYRARSNIAAFYEWLGALGAYAY